MIFALELDRPPTQWTDIPALLPSWLVDAGMITALAVVIGSLFYLLERRPSEKRGFSPVAWAFIICVILSGVAYAAFFILLSAQSVTLEDITVEGQKAKAIQFSREQSVSLRIAGLFALLAAAVPMLVRLVGRLSWRRVWALTRLSIKEAIRGRVLWIFCVMALIFLFYGYFVSYKPEDQIRNYVEVIDTSLRVMFLPVAILLGSFSIPNDVVRQTIHTIVTKPVERYEIVLGRFLGYGLLLTAVLIVLTLLSFLYMVRRITPEATAESYKARVVQLPSALRFYNTQHEDRGENVGREWDYRSYIRGRLPGEALQQYAGWSFERLPTTLGRGEPTVPFEFTFDIFRTNKGKEDKGVICDLYFVDGRYSTTEMENAVKSFNKDLERAQDEIDKKWKKKYDAASGDAGHREIEEEKQREIDQVRQELVETHRVWVAAGLEVTDYHTLRVDVPSALITKLCEDQPADSSSATADGTVEPALKVLVAVSPDRYSRQQMLGVARTDLYLLAVELPFWQNLFKGMFGLWCLTMLFLAIAVACSTYLSGVVSLLVSLFFLVMAFAKDFILALVHRVTFGGGPLESANRLFQHLPSGAPLEQTTALTVGQQLDVVYSWALAFVRKMLPNAHQFNLSQYVADGFDIPWSVLLGENLLPLLGFLVPWAVLAYYLMNSREVANPT
jgi:ABC-type transport system involved in multi-copper enzyme maturation permease subunit